MQPLPKTKIYGEKTDLFTGNNPLILVCMSRKVQFSSRGSGCFALSLSHIPNGTSDLWKRKKIYVYCDCVKENNK